LMQNGTYIQLIPLRFTHMSLPPIYRRELIERADGIVRIARSMPKEKRSDDLRRAARLYREATLGLMADIIDEEADELELDG
jgi:hypothetical protein